MSIFVLWLVATFNFVIFSFTQGGPVANIQDPSFTNIDPETQQMILERYGWGTPWYIQYLKYLRNMFTYGIVPPHFGWSTMTNQFVAQAMSWRLPITLFLMGSALIGTIIIGVPIGVFAASKQGSKKDIMLIGSSLFTWALPLFFVQLLAITFFGKILRDTYGISIFTTTWTTPGIPVKNIEWWVGVFSRLTLPILTLILVGFGSWALQVRFMLVDALSQDFVSTARAKGLSERVVLYKHAFKSILPQILTMITLSIPAIVTGSIITEYVFGIEGIGKWYLRILEAGDLTVITLDSAVAQAVFFIYATIVVACNFIADVLYGVFDPRIRVGARRRD